MHDEALMDQAITAASCVRTSTAPNPWVGAALRTVDGTVVLGATEPPGRRHAEIVALEAAGDGARGATMAVTLEPCSHVGRTGPCADALIAAGVGRVVVAVEDPDPRVAGRGLSRLRDAGIEVVIGTRASTVRQQLAAYLHHRHTGRPLVVLKLAATLDGRTAAPDGSSQWITGIDARTDAHRLRAESGAILVGAGTVRTDDPALTTRHVPGPDPQRIVLGEVPSGARVHPCRSWNGPVAALLDELGAAGILQVLVEGGATVANSLLSDDLIDRVVVYLAPALFGGDDALGLFRGPGAGTIADIRRGHVVDLRRLGPDVRIEVDLRAEHSTPPSSLEAT